MRRLCRGLRAFILQPRANRQVRHTHTQTTAYGTNIFLLLTIINVLYVVVQRFWPSIPNANTTINPLRACADIPMTVRPVCGNSNTAVATTVSTTNSCTVAAVAAGAALAPLSSSSAKAKGEPPPSYTTLQQGSPCSHRHQHQQHQQQLHVMSTSNATIGSNAPATASGGCDVVYSTSSKQQQQQQQQQVSHIPGKHNFIFGHAICPVLARPGTWLRGR